MNSKDLIERWFKGRPGGGLVLPDGWFGRPHDNIHQLSGVFVDDGALAVSLDDGQLMLNFEGPLQVDATHEALVLAGFSCLSFAWKDYGSGRRHTQRFESGIARIVAAPGI